MVIDRDELEAGALCELRDGTLASVVEIRKGSDNLALIRWDREVTGTEADTEDNWEWFYDATGNWIGDREQGNHIVRVLDKEVSPYNITEATEVAKILREGNEKRDSITPEFIEAVPEIIDEVTQQQPERALRLNTGKIDSTHIHPAMLWPLYRVGHFGGKKYDRHNYLKGGKPASEYLASARRHLDLAASGERVDPESGCGHLAHAAWNCLFLLMCQNFGLLGEDDLPPPINFDTLRNLMKE